MSTCDHLAPGSPTLLSSNRGRVNRQVIPTPDPIAARILISEPAPVLGIRRESLDAAGSMMRRRWMLDCSVRQEVRGQTELLRRFSASITLLNFLWWSYYLRCMNGAELGYESPPGYEAPISRFNDRKSLATMIRLDTSMLRKRTRPRRHPSTQHVLSGGKTNN
ncbi:hypothetical protein OIDMADRAFT_36523 [Oidiodendron maius Zn]|uniref:Uncharacterized protein n=1 Tax=Oidiodendron maius (strain Zn) TaxID=913774 RepID=A0A0C3GLT6_OIDMZ|nr:hypothetical protein OIDMADRAFT_36523 [Oidiodendron maius Zn]